MNPLMVFGKTARGSAEVAQRSAGLTLAARRVLILVDGRRTVTELTPLARPGEIEPLLTQLWQAGFIEPLAPATDEARDRAPPPAGPPTIRVPTRPPLPPPASSPAATESASGSRSERPATVPGTTVAGAGRAADGPTSGEPPRAITLDEAKRRAVRALRDRVGPDADDMAAAIERCRSSEEFAERLLKAERLIAVLGGDAAAADFVRAVRGR